jgi:hypothetical protein
VSTTTTWSALLLLGGALGGWGCAPKEAVHPDAAQEPPAAEAAAPYGPGYAQPPPEPSSPAALPQFGLDQAERPRSTVEEASSSLDTDEQLLHQLLDQPGVALGAGLDACRRVCAALGSMERSVDAICDLAGPDDPRCDRARQRLEVNSRRVDEAGCRC